MNQNKIPDPHKLELIAQTIESNNNFLITCHVQPDGDALGAMLALGLALEDAKKDVIMFYDDNISNKYRFMPGYDKILKSYNNDDLFTNKNLIILDCNDYKRVTKTIIENINLFNSIIVLDHHEYFTPFFDGLLKKIENKNHLEYIYSNICSSGTIIYHLIKMMNLTITPCIATNIFTAISFDTGGFRYSNTSSNAFRIAAELVDCGANPYLISNNLFYSHSEKRQHLLSLVLRTLELKANKKIGVMHLTPDMLKATGATEDDTGDFISYIRSIESVEVSIFVKEIRPNEVFVSLRSRNDFDVANFAKLFNGGGHKKAAGFSTSGTAMEVREKILNRLLNMEPFNVSKS